MWCKNVTAGVLTVQFYNCSLPLNITTTKRVSWETVLDRTTLHWEKIINETMLTEYAYTFLIGNIVGLSSPTFKLRQKDIKLSEQKGFPEITL